MLARLAALVVTATLLPLQGTAQSLAEAARKERERREQASARRKPAKVFSDDDLKKADEDQKKEEQKREPSGASPEQTRRSLEEDASERQEQRDGWVRRGEERRDAIADAQRRVDALTAELERSRLDMDPNAGVLDPSRMQTLEAQVAKLKADLEAAKQQLQQAKEAFAALEDEARRKGIPPGWLRERS